MGVFSVFRSPSLTQLLLITLFLTPSNSSVTTNAETAYELLQRYNFPVGLLPKGVVNYTLENTSGKFSVTLNGSCSFALEDSSYQLKYKSTIKGTIMKNKLKDLQGVSVKVFLFWVNIVEVDRSGEDLDFWVGIASATFPIGNFEECPRCGCGLDCVNDQDLTQSSFACIGGKIDTDGHKPGAMEEKFDGSSKLLWTTKTVSWLRGITTQNKLLEDMFPVSRESPQSPFTCTGSKVDMPVTNSGLLAVQFITWQAAAAAR
ncbi:hypothetical protein IFM89_017458 [Coptis chinensis]|uniref:DUF538 family protein n=1 Tax=Coptis chinensis TaxID=261450 RepID=A0A835LW54_9MAGN|nr:hypothetical protein IFM89_017458 [Coptis chinensis]